MNISHITYTIEFFSYWQIGSGKGKGNQSDTSVLKDKNGLPFIPGKTLKGLILDAIQFKPISTNLDNDIPKPISFHNLEEYIQTGYFGNACLEEEEVQALTGNRELINELYEVKAFIQLNDEKQTVKGALRTEEVTIPVKMQGKIECAREDLELITSALPMIKHIGLKRNRGFGRCKITLQ